MTLRFPAALQPSVPSGVAAQSALDPAELEAGAAGHRQRRAAARGFTLVELMVVVTIVGMMAMIAVPSAVERMRERRSQEAAQRVASMYRNARIRAMGRGAAVLVRYNKTSGFEVFEAIRGSAMAGASCANEPFRSCVDPSGVDRWSDATLRVSLTQFDPARRAEYEGVQVNALPTSSSAPADTYLDVCFTPLGRAYTRNAASPQPLTPMVGVATFEVSRGSRGLKRTVAVLPNGTARLGL